MKTIFLLDEDEKKVLYKNLKKVMKKEQNVEIVNINVKDIIQKFKTIPDICIINEENIGIDIK